MTDEKKNEEAALIWGEYHKMLDFLVEQKQLNVAGTKFVKGMKSYLNNFGYLSEKQKMSVKTMFETYSDSF